MTYRLGVDVGGTFTDLLLVDEDTGRPAPGQDPLHAGRPVGRRAASASTRSARWPGSSRRDRPRHARHDRGHQRVLEGKGAKVGLVVTRGYRQVLQVARSFVPGGLAGWIIWPKPEPLAALENTVEAVERVGARGEVVDASWTRPTCCRSWRTCGTRAWTRSPSR